MFTTTTPAVPVKPAALTVQLARKYAHLVLEDTAQHGNVTSYRLGKCGPVGKTVVCTFSMLMSDGRTVCRGRIQFRLYHGDVQKRFVRVRCS